MLPFYPGVNSPWPTTSGPGRSTTDFPQSGYTERGAVMNDIMALKDGILARGVLFDIPKLRGVPYLGDSEAIYPEDLEAW
jgi:hypothetical protein